MTIDRTDPSEVAGARPRRVWWVLAAVVAIVAAVVAVVMVRSGDEQVADTMPPTVAATEPPSTEPQPAPIADPVVGFPDGGSDYIGVPLKVLAERTTATGVQLKLFDQGDWMGAGAMMVDGPGPMAPAQVEVLTAGAMTVPASTVAGADGEVITVTMDANNSVVMSRHVVSDDVVVAAPAPPTGMWQPAPWCWGTGGYRLAMSLKGSVSIANGQKFSALRDGVHVTTHTGGQADGAPFRAMVLQLDPGITKVSVRYSDGATDTAEAHDGWALLGAPGNANGQFTLQLTGKDGVRTLDWRQVPSDNDAEFTRGCNPPPPGLPAPGAEQPADLESARVAVRDQFDLLFNSALDFDKRQSALDDTTGVADAIEQVSNGSFADAVANVRYSLTDVVFADATHAWLQYDISSPAANFTGRFGEAVLVDGTWKITRATMCQDLSLAGGSCVPFAQPVNPPGVNFGFAVENGGDR